ncbi:MAG: heavy metal-binding domain-containing protein [Actinomycetes bacterium]
MKTKDIAKQYGFDLKLLEHWLRLPHTQYKQKNGMGGMSVDDSVDMRALAADFTQWANQVEATRAQEQQAAALAAQEKQQAAALAAQEKQRALAGMLITSGFNFDGYTITKYSGYISGDDAVSMNRPSQGFWGSVDGNVGQDLLRGLVHIRRNALAELKESAYALGCNAVIGVDFDYLSLDPETATSNGGTLYLPFLFAVTANGNAVVIEKNDRTALGSG